MWKATKRSICFGRPCAMYNLDTGLLHDPNSETPVGYVSLTNIFVGSSWIAEQLFPEKLKPIFRHKDPGNR